MKHGLTPDLDYEITLTAAGNRSNVLFKSRVFTLGVRECKATCDFFAFCQGSHAGNRYFEHGTFTGTETDHCRNSTQALVLALHDLSYPKGIAA